MVIWYGEFGTACLGQPGDLVWFSLASCLDPFRFRFVNTELYHFSWLLAAGCRLSYLLDPASVLVVCSGCLLPAGCFFLLFLAFCFSLFDHLFMFSGLIPLDAGILS